MVDDDGTPSSPSAGTPRLVRRKVLAVVPRLCPSCLGTLQRVSQLGGWLTPQDYYCPKCGYRGYVYVEEDPEQKKQEQQKKRAD